MLQKIKTLLTNISLCAIIVSCDGCGKNSTSIQEDALIPSISLPSSIPLIPSPPPSITENNICNSSSNMLIDAPRNPLSGTEISNNLLEMNRAAQNEFILRMAREGNIPNQLRNLVAVSSQNGTICVMPDYFALGTDDDYLRVPMTAFMATEIANMYGMSLPTSTIVDDIYLQSDIQLAPIPMTPGAQMGSVQYYIRHNALINTALSNRQGLVAGHKKDIIRTLRDGRVTIYGWHRSNGNPIQPVSSIHAASYYDYSHGLRLIMRIT